MSWPGWLWDIKKNFIRGESDVRVLGGDDFLEKVLELPLPAKGRMPTLSAVVEKIGKAYGHKGEDLKDPGRNRHLVGLVAVHTGIVSLSVVASFFGRDIATSNVYLVSKSY